MRSPEEPAPPRPRWLPLPHSGGSQRRQLAFSLTGPEERARGDVVRTCTVSYRRAVCAPVRTSLRVEERSLSLLMYITVCHANEGIFVGQVSTYLLTYLLYFTY